MNEIPKTTTLTSREFNQDLARAKRAAAGGPVIVTDRGKPAHVLLSYDEYRSLLGEEPAQRRSLIDMLAMPPGVEDIEVEFPRSREPARYDGFD